MKTISIILLITLSGTVPASDDGNDGSSAAVSPVTENTDSITMNVVNTWPITWAQQCLGMDVWEDGSEVFAMFSSPYYDGIISSLDVSTGGWGGSMDLDPSNNNAFGIAFNNNIAHAIYLTDDWQINDLFFTEDEGTTWNTTPNYVENRGRGMDFDGSDYWMTNNDIGVCRFVPETGAQLITLPEVTNKLAGLTTFPFNGDTGIALTAYDTSTMWFYSWDGTDMTFIGTADCPLACSNSFGLAYSEIRDTIFWSYKEGGNYYISEIEFTITSLDQSTWGSIKADF